MRRFRLMLTFLCLAWIGRTVVAGEIAGKPLGDALRCSRCAAVPCVCPDDYCRKPFPCLPCLRLPGLPDDYCRKPFPCIPGLGPGRCADDYCRKPVPDPCGPVLRQFYRCPPLERQAP